MVQQQLDGMGHLEAAVAVGAHRLGVAVLAPIGVAIHVLREPVGGSMVLGVDRLVTVQALASLMAVGAETEVAPLAVARDEPLSVGHIPWQSEQ